MKISLLSSGLLLAIWSAAAHAQPTFAPDVRYATVVSPDDVVAGDLDGDGDTDLVVASSSVSVLLGNGDGTFGAVSDFYAGDVPFELALGDLDNDGNLDVVTANLRPASLDGDLAALLGNGDGTFGAALLFPAGTVPNCVTLGDFDEDGALDAAVGNSALGGGVKLFMGNGDGTFDPFVTLAAGTEPTDVQSADVDEDGHLDLLASDADQDVHVLLGNGDGTFAAAIVVSAGGFGDGMDIDLADFDRDGNLDLVTSHGADSEVGILLGDGTGAFGAVTYFSAGNYPTDVTAADIDGDAMIDVVAVDRFSDELVVLEGAGDGTLGPAIAFATGDFPTGAVAADLDGDHDLDVAVPNLFTQDVSVLINLRPASRVGLNGAACAFVSITDAVAAATSGDDIYASPGLYTEPTIVLSGTTATIVGSDAACGAVTSGLVTVEPVAGRLFELDASVLTLIGLTAQGGSTSTDGGTVYAENGSTLLLSNTTVRNGTSTVNGGCVYATASGVSLLGGSSVEGCTATGYGGGVYIDVGGSLLMNAGTFIRDNVAVGGAGGGAVVGGSIAHIEGEISGNEALGGGGLWAAYLDATPADVTFAGRALVDGNTTTGFGGGINLFGSNTIVRLTEDTVVSNNEAAYGAGVSVVAATLTLTDRVSLVDNRATSDGGAIHADASTVDATGIGLGDVEFRGNDAVGQGGGVFLRGGSLGATFVDFTGNTANGGGGIWAENASVTTLRNNRFWNNVAGAEGGGAIYAVDAGTSLDVRSNFGSCDPTVLSRSRYCSEFVVNRTTGTGGAIKIIGEAAADIRTTAFIANDSPLNGEAVMVYKNVGAPSQATLRNTLFHHHLGGVAPAVGVTNSDVDILSSTFSDNEYPVAYLTGGTGVFHRNVVWGNVNDADLPGISGNCNTTQTVAGSPAGVNNDQLDPMFDAAHARSPYKLLAGSPAIDACNAGPSRDLDAAFRPINMLWDKGVFEMP